MFGKLGIIQGRLLQAPRGVLQYFPQDCWENEFYLASSSGLGYIELLAERVYNNKNPIWSNEGNKKIQKLAEENNLLLYSICNDYVIKHSLLLDNDAIRQTINLIRRASVLGISKLILPLFEKSQISINQFSIWKKILCDIAIEAEKNNILLCIETDLSGSYLLDFLSEINHSAIACTFDTGNSIALGHDIYSDILLLKEHIQHVHLKDKNNNNQNVFLGTGNVNFYQVLRLLHSVHYQGCYTFETCRGAHPLETAKYNISFIQFFMKESANDAH